MDILLDIAALIIIYVFIFFRKWHRKGLKILFLNTTIYVYISFVLYFTLMPIICSIPNLFDRTYGYAVNLIPFVDVINRRGNFIRQIILNVIMTIPFGFLLPVANKNINLIKTVLLTMSFSICIEFLQLFSITFRATDITDVITNTAGGLIGYLIYAAVRNIMLKIKP